MTLLQDHQIKMVAIMDTFGEEYPVRFVDESTSFAPSPRVARRRCGCSWLTAS